MPLILSYLPSLIALDTDYTVAGFLRPSERSLPPLRLLIVHTSSLDNTGPREIWRWIRELVPRSSLETLALHLFCVQGEMVLPRAFIIALADVHKNTLKNLHFTTTQLTMDDIGCVCSMFPRLEKLECSIAGPATVFTSRVDRVLDVDSTFSESNR